MDKIGLKNKYLVLSGLENFRLIIFTFYNYLHFAKVKTEYGGSGLKHTDIHANGNKNKSFLVKCQNPMMQVFKVFLSL